MKIMIDLRTGEPVLDLEGSIQEVNVERAFYQLIDCLLHTPIMTEHLNPTWGVDYRGIIRASSHPNWESIIKYMFVEAVSPSREPIVSSINAVSVTRNDDGNDLQVQIELKSKYNTLSVNKVGVNE